MSPLVAIDGPAGSGKSTIAAALASRLGLERLDTGAMYRAVTLLVLRTGTVPFDEGLAVELARTMTLDPGTPTLLNGEDVTEAIRTAEVDRAVSVVAAHPGVRHELVRRQREWAEEHGGGVVEGRDIGSVVFPEADVKVFLTADPAVRARRRVSQRAGLGEWDKPESVELDDLVRRDSHDSSRASSPLTVPEGAVVIDSSELSVDEVVDEVLRQL